METRSYISRMRGPGPSASTSTARAAECRARSFPCRGRSRHRRSRGACIRLTVNCIWPDSRSGNRTPRTCRASPGCATRGGPALFPLRCARASRESSCASRYELQSWNYRRTSGYGSGHFKRDGSAGHDRANVVAHLAPDGRTLLLVVPQMQPVMQMQLDYDLRSAGGTPLRNSLYLTVQSVDPLDLRAAGFPALDWRASDRRATTGGTAARTASSSAELGARVFQRAGCIACHSVDGTQAGKTGPTLKGVHGSQVKLVGKPAVRADDAYLTRSITDPGAEIVQGYEPGMPSFRGVLSEAEIRSVVMYIRSLGAAVGR